MLPRFLHRFDCNGTELDRIPRRGHGMADKTGVTHFYPALNNQRIFFQSLQ